MATRGYRFFDRWQDQESKALYIYIHLRWRRVATGSVTGGKTRRVINMALFTHDGDVRLQVLWQATRLAGEQGSIYSRVRSTRWRRMARFFDRLHTRPAVEQDSIYSRVRSTRWRRMAVGSLAGSKTMMRGPNRLHGHNHHHVRPPCVFMKIDGPKEDTPQATTRLDREPRYRYIYTHNSGQVHRAYNFHYVRPSAKRVP